MSVSLLITSELAKELHRSEPESQKRPAVPLISQNGRAGGSLQPEHCVQSSELFSGTTDPMRGWAFRDHGPLRIWNELVYGRLYLSKKRARFWCEDSWGLLSQLTGNSRRTVLQRCTKKKTAMPTGLRTSLTTSFYQCLFGICPSIPNLTGFSVLCA